MSGREPVTTEVATYIAQRIERFAVEAPAEWRWQMPCAVRYGVLPTYIGWTEAFGLRPTGEVIRWSVEGEYVGWRPIEEWGDRMTAVVEGARRYPGLASLIPNRPVDATECSWCHDSPRVRSGELGCAECGGLGWLPK